MEQNGKTLTAVNLKNIDIQVDGVTVYLNGDTLHVIDNYNPGKIKDLQEEITILREQLRGTREELARERELKEEAMDKDMKQFAIVRWHENPKEDIVCVDVETARRYVAAYNKSAGSEVCYWDKDIYHPIEQIRHATDEEQLLEEITILREQLRGTREELAQVRKGGIEDEEKKPTPEERFWDLFRGCTVETSEKYPGYTFLFKDGKHFFELRKDILWCSCTNVWGVFEKEYNMPDEEIQNLINIQLEEHFKCNGVTAKKSCGGSCHLIEEHFKQAK